MNRSYKILKLTIYIILFLFTLLIIIRIKNINESEQTKVIIYSKSNIPRFDDIEMNIKEFLIFDNVIDYKERYSVTDVGTVSNDDKILVLEIIIKNCSDDNIMISEIVGKVGMGIETKTWFSVFSPDLSIGLNQYSNDYVIPDEEIVYKIVIPINKITLKKTTWSKIDKEQYYYVLSVGELTKKIYLGKPLRN